MIEIRQLQDTTEAEVCAHLMADSEPWITLRRDYAACLKAVSSPEKETYVATVEDQIVGFIVLNMQGAFVGYIQSIGVAPEWRNRGIGRQLIAFAEERIFSQMPNVFVCVSSFNKEAQRLYKRLGYQAIGELKDYLVAGHAEILLRKTIAPLTEFRMESHEGGG
ncbi:MAG: GNAT family N-acetyltransferase [Chloroflexota bacterium]|nr:GNAT family N-acetyltransferase [Chloroflexota bacterium]